MCRWSGIRDAAGNRCRCRVGGEAARGAWRRGGGGRHVTPADRQTLTEDPVQQLRQKAWGGGGGAVKGGGGGAGETGFGGKTAPET